MDWSGIEWTDHTFNGWWGCVENSPACDHCYARVWDRRLGGFHWGKLAPRRFFGPKHWAEPKKWARRARETGRPEFVFCQSMGDVFERRVDLDPERVKLWRLIEETHEDLVWMLLTKFPGNILRMVPKDWRRRFPDNVWALTTAENQACLERRVRELVLVPADVLGLSCEPLLGALDAAYCLGQGGINWVIAGGESGHGARPPHPSWFISLRDQCAAAGVPFFFKQWGEWRHEEAGDRGNFADVPRRWLRPDGSEGAGEYGRGDALMLKVGKKVAGRQLDGVEHSERPEPVAA